MMSKESNLSLHSKLLVNLLVSPLTLIPVVVGLSTLLVNWAIQGIALYYLLGFVSFLSGIGMALSKFILGFDKLIEDTINEEEEKQETKELQNRQIYINSIRKEITSCRDKESKDLFDELIRLFNLMKSEVLDNQIIESMRDEVEESTNRLVDQCLSFIKKATSLERQIDSITSKSKEALKTKKNFSQSKQKILEQVEKSLEEFRTIVQSYHDLITDDTSSELQKVQNDLRENLEIAKRVKERMGSFDFSNTTVKEF